MTTTSTRSSATIHQRSNRTSPTDSKPFTRFCGIDVAKHKHVACVLDQNGVFVARSQSFDNDAEGYQLFLERLQKAGGSSRILTAMEATGHYWYSLHDFLVRHGYAVVVLNPIQTAQQARKGIRKCQTDAIDARHIATLIKNGEHRPALVPGELAMTCRQLTRLRYDLIRRTSRIKQTLWSRVHPVWPEYESLFKDPLGKTGRKLLVTAPTPADVLALAEPELNELLRKTSRGKFGPAHAAKIRQAAAHTVGMRRGLEGARIGIRALLNQIEALRPIREQLEADITTLADRLPVYLFTLPGADALKAASLFGETDPIETFTSSSQLVAFAGLDPIVSQSGEYQAPHRHISKRGSPFLRKTLWGMTLRALQQEGDLQSYWLRKRREGVHHLAAVTATAIKLCHVIWRILTDRRDYLPQRPATKP
jgi:transposase